MAVAAVLPAAVLAALRYARMGEACGAPRAVAVAAVVWGCLAKQTVSGPETACFSLPNGLFGKVKRHVLPMR